MQLSDFNLTTEQRDQVLTEEINRRVRKGATLLEVDDDSATLRYGPELGRLDAVYLVALWVFNIIMSLVTLGLWLILLAVCWGLFHKLWRRSEIVRVDETGRVDSAVFGKTVTHILEARLRRQYA